MWRDLDDPLRQFQNSGGCSVRILLFVAVLISGGTLASADPYDDCAQRRDLELSIRACTEIIERGGSEPSSHLSISYKDRADSYFANGDYERAITDLGAAITQSPEDADAYIKRGMAYDAKGDYQRGIADFDVAIKLRPTSSTPYTMRGGAYERAGDRERAIADFEKALEIEPDLPTVREVLKRLKSK
jgi:tetratricopeptide (TPR) repeat protein